MILDVEVKHLLPLYKIFNNKCLTLELKIQGTKGISGARCKGDRGQRGVAGPEAKATGARGGGNSCGATYPEVKGAMQ